MAFGSADFASELHLFVRNLAADELALKVLPDDRSVSLGTISEDN